MFRYLKNISIRRRSLYVVMLLFIIAFQSYWLRSNYNIQKNEILKDVENKVQKISMLITLQQLAGSIYVVSKNANENVSLESLGSGDCMVDGLFSNADLEEYAKFASITFTLNNPSVLIADTAQDSLLYTYLLTTLPDLAGQDKHNIVIYHQALHSFKSYPRGTAFINNNNTQPIIAKLNAGSTFQIHIRRLNIIILKRMLSVFAFSLFYILLFAATMYAIIRADRQSKKLLESQTNFTNNMTHELKIPVSTLYLATESLDKYSRQDDPAEVRRHVSIIYQGLHQLSYIIDKILTGARQQQHLPLRREAINIRQLIDEVVKSMQLQLSQKNAMVNTSAVSETAFIYADYEQMRHVFFNLIDNAIKYSSTSPRVSVSLSTARQMHTLLFADNGKGIPPRYFKDIFKPYFRIPELDLHSVKGYGLGLSFVRHIVRLHSGTVRVARSAEGKGTVIEIKLPVYDA